MKKKRLLALTMALSMTVSALFDGNIVASAATNEKADFVGQYATGDLTTSASYFADRNDLSEKEFVEMINEDSDPDNDIDLELANSDKVESDKLPSSCDNSTSKYFPAVGNQRSIGSCTTWAEVYYGFTYSYNRAHDITSTGDNVYSPAFVYNQIKGTSGGSSSTSALAVLMKEGAPSKNNADFESYSSESSCLSWFPQESIWSEASSRRLTGYYDLIVPTDISSNTDSDLNEMKTYLSSGYLINYSTDFYSWQYTNTSAEGNYPNEYICYGTNGSGGSHRMTIVGYDDNVCCDIDEDGHISDVERGAFKIVNSWGTYYRNNGFIWVSYDALNTVTKTAKTFSDRNRVFRSASVQYCKPETVNSNVNLVMTLNTVSRNNAKIYVSAKKTDGTVKTAAFTAFYQANRNSCALDGKSVASQGTVTFDLANVVADITPETVNDYTWTVEIYDTASSAEKGITLVDASIKANNNVCLYAKTDNKSVYGYNTVTYDFSKDKQEVATVYYKNSNYSNAYIHYKAGNGSWTDAPGVKMSASDNSNYTWMYRIPLGSASEATVCFNNGNNKWDSNDGSNYKVSAGKNAVSSGKVKKLGIEASISYVGPVGSVYALVNAEGGVAPYTYEYSLTKDGSFLRSGTSTNGKIYLSCYDKCTHGITVTVTDATGETTTITDTYDYPGLILTMSADKKSPCKTNDTVTFTVNRENYYYYYSDYYSFWSVTKDGKSYDISSNGLSATWTPTEAGLYTVTYDIPYYMGNDRSVSMTYEVKDDTVNTAVVYYNTSWSKAYIHYKAGNGNWTNAPGVKMSASDIDGYNYMYTIDLGDASDATVCFNNGNGSWDSNGGNNYKLEAGTYGVKNGNVSKITASKDLSVKLATDKSVGGTYNPLTLTADTKNATGDCTYTFSVSKDGGKEYILAMATTSNQYVWNTLTAAGTYDIFVKVQDGAGKTASDSIKGFVVEGEKWDYFKTNLASPQKSGTSITLEASYINVQQDKYNYYSFSATKDGKTTNLTSNGNQATWTPTEEGTYTLTATFTSYTGSSKSTTMTYTIKSSNTVTVYYNNSNYSSANIHYQVGNGQWTSVPGVKMASSDESKYTWMYVIDLGDASYANVCFNNGYGNWDSNGGSNYRLTAGKSAIIYGNIYRLN